MKPVRIAVYILAFTVPSLPALSRDDAPPSAPAPIRVAIYDDTGIGGNGPANLEKCLAKDAVFVCRRVKAEEIRAGVLAGQDLLLMPGGTASGEAKSLEEKGREAIRAFVGKGGGYVGFCAGAYLATCQQSFYLKILDADIKDTEHWKRGTGRVRIRLTEDGGNLLETKELDREIHYANGPLLARGGNADVPDFKPLARFVSEMAENGAPSGVMKGTVASACGAFGKGRVLVFSPHPEKTDGLDGFVRHAARWAAGREGNGVKEATPAVAEPVEETGSGK